MAGRWLTPAELFTAAERNYTQREKELLPIVFATENFHEPERFRVETKYDEVVQAMKALVQSGWPADKRVLPPTVVLYYNVRDVSVIQDGLLFVGDGLVMPKTLRKRTLQTLHSCQQAIESTLRRARGTIY